MKRYLRALAGLSIIAAVAIPAIADRSRDSLKSAVEARPAPTIERATIRDEFTPEEKALADKLANEELKRLQNEHRELKGLFITNIRGYIHEDGVAPEGVVVEMRVPTPVDVIRLSLVRTRDNKPELIPSEIYNLRALSSAIAFKPGVVVDRGIIPTIEEAQDPD